MGLTVGLCQLQQCCVWVTAVDLIAISDFTISQILDHLVFDGMNEFSVLLKDGDLNSYNKYTEFASIHQRPGKHTVWETAY